MAITRILAATDLGEKSEGTLRHAAHLTRQLGGELYVIHVTSSADLGDLDSPSHQPDRKADSLQADATRRLRVQLEHLFGESPDFPLEAVVRFGDPRQEILQYARSLQCAYIVITVESRSRLGKLLMGSHSQQVLLDSEIPVIAVKPGWSP